MRFMVGTSIAFAVRQYIVRTENSEHSALYQIQDVKSSRPTWPRCQNFRSRPRIRPWLH